jgi:hypothetical protein
MSKYVFRTDLRQRPVSPPLRCIEPSEIFFAPGECTVDECVQTLLAGDEICLSGNGKREIMQGPRLVGYIRIVDAV